MTDVVEAVGELVSADDPWTSRRELRERARDGTGGTLLDLTKREVDEAVQRAVEAGDLVYWGGLITLVDDEHINAAIEREIEADVPRVLLIGKLNKIKMGAWNFNETTGRGAFGGNA